MPRLEKKLVVSTVALQMESQKLLTKNLELNPELNVFLNHEQWSEYTSNLTLAIIGPQGTGKSTLMNNLFGESFKEKQQDAVGRTTVGADLKILEKSDTECFLLIDSEGINCSERLEDFEGDREKQAVFDTQLTSFIFSAVDVLIVNINVNQIGREGSSCIKLAIDITEINSKLIKTDTRKKTIIFVIRDFNPKTSSEELIKQKIEDSIWSNEEEKTKDSFDKKFVFIRNIELEAKFKEGCKSLKSTLDDLLKEKKGSCAISSLAQDFATKLDIIKDYYKLSAEKLK